MTERCNAVIYWNGGSVVRCQSHSAKGSEYCYHHRKYFEIEDYYPSPQDWKYRDEAEENGEYVEKITNMEGTITRRFDYQKHRPVSMYNPSPTIR